VISQASCTKYWPPFAPWVHRGGGAGRGGVCVLRGVQLGPWAIGRCWVRWPVTPTGTSALAPLPLPRTDGCRSGAEACRFRMALRDHTARAHAATPFPATASVSSCAASCFVARVRAIRHPRRKKRLLQPGREPRGYLHAGGGHAKRPSSSTPGMQTKWGGCREVPLASDIGSFSHGRAIRAESWSTRFHCIRQQAQARCATW
jgi:hypothetical protein